MRLSKTITVASLSVVSLVTMLMSLAQAIPLQTLADANLAIQEGDKFFTNFRFNPFPIFLGNASPFPPQTLDVQGRTIGSEHGLRFSGPFTGSTAQGGSIASGDWDITFDVVTRDPSKSITGVRHAYEVTYAGSGNAGVSTNVRNCPFSVCVGPGEFDRTLSSSALSAGSPPSPASLNEARSLPATNFLRVDNRIFLNTGSVFAPQPSSVSVPFVDVLFTQFTQPVGAPAPPTNVLLGPGLSVLWLWRNRQWVLIRLRRLNG